MRADQVDDLLTAWGEDISTVAPGLDRDETHHGHTSHKADKHPEN